MNDQTQSQHQSAGARIYSVSIVTSVHHVFKYTQTPKALNKSRNMHIRERRLANKFTVKKNIYPNSAKLYRKKTTTLLLKMWT